MPPLLHICSSCSGRLPLAQLALAASFDRGGNFLATAFSHHVDPHTPQWKFSGNSSWWTGQLTISSFHYNLGIAFSTQKSLRSNKFKAAHLSHKVLKPGILLCLVWSNWVQIGGLDSQSMICKTQSVTTIWNSIWTSPRGADNDTSCRL